MHKININNQEYIMRVIVDDKGNVDHKAQLEVEEKWKGMTIEKPTLTLITNKQYIKSLKD
jgi:hypothetical protein